MYGENFFLVLNKIDCYTIADYTPGLKYNADGTLDIYIQNKEPKDHISNCLPVPKGNFNLVLRMY
ncbi:MAG: DUF1214 domain-containing protein [Acutalibacteraceae bacterium]|jgi:hypothetical protein